MRALTRAGFFAFLCGCSQDYTDIGSSQSRDTSPSTADVPQLATDEADFTFAFYRAQVGGDETSNVFFSPYSISVALAMAYAGAGTDTASQMASAMHFSLPPAELHAAFDAVDLALTSRQGIRLAVANSIWGQRTLGFAGPFLDTLAIDYGSEVRGVDFIDDSVQAENAINGWVADQTEGKIQNLFQPGALNGSTRVVLVNAVYFDATWQTQFDPSQTSASSFTKLDGSVESVPLMNITNVALKTAQTETYTAVEVPYSQGQTTMLVVMPTQGQFAQLEAGLSGDFLASVVGGLASEADVQLSLPKFTIQGASVSLKNALSSLGMVNAFDPTSADFNAMVPNGGIFIEDVIHQAYVRVDENGTQAAAATGVDEGALAVEEPLVVDVNRPFFFFIRDVPTGAVLFAGRVVDPAL
jgi:serpin B